MVADISEVVSKYEERMRSVQKVPRFSHGRRMLRADGGPNKLFFCTLFNDHAMAIQFLQEIGLLRRTMQYHVPLGGPSPVTIFRLEF